MACSSHLRCSSSSIRDLTVAAPLKLGFRLPPRRNHHPIRDLTVAAPLKQIRGNECWRDLNYYPRPDGRGPIEARCSQIHTHSPQNYPRPDGRGPIEARLSTRLGSGSLGYPRPDGRGPIEAASEQRRWRKRSPTIRDLTVAAPLKHGGLIALPASSRRYPRPDGRGPIEAENAPSYVDDGGNLSAT